MTVDLVAAQLTALQKRFPDARLEIMTDGQHVLVVPDVALSAGWSKDRVTVRVLVPAGFPHVKPDCFYVDPDLRLQSGAEPASGNLQAVFGTQYRWFSWHLSSWDPATGSLDQYVRFCQGRLKEVR